MSTYLGYYGYIGTVIFSCMFNSIRLVLAQNKNITFTNKLVSCLLITFMQDKSILHVLHPIIISSTEKGNTMTNHKPSTGGFLGIPYSGKLLREKTFTNFAIFQPSVKVFSTKF